MITASNSQIVLRHAAALEYPTAVARNDDAEKQKTKFKKTLKSKKSSKKILL